MKSFHYKSSRFSYTARGKGTSVIFLHGFLEEQSMWNGLIDFLPDHYRAVTLDLPGHGGSGNLGYVHSMEDMAEVVKALADHLKLKRFFLAGHSMGGYVALAFTEKYPGMVKSVVLLNSSARADSAAKKKDRDRAIALVKEDYKGFIRKSIPNLFRPKNRRIYQDVIREIKQKALQTSQQGVIAALEGMKVRPDREALLHSGPCNFLLIAAEKDPALPFATLQEQLQAARVTPLVTANGHMAHIEDREPVFEKIKQFLKDHT